MTGWGMASRRALGRNAQVRSLAILSVSLLAHGLVLLFLVSGLKPPAPIPPSPAVEITLLSPPPSLTAERRTAKRQPRPEPLSMPLAATGPRSGSPEGPASGSGPMIALPANPDGASALVQGPSLQPGLRRQLGCANAAFLKLSQAELDTCAQRLAEGAGRAPQLAVISPAKKAIFDSDCPPKDDWCLYRTGQGPYPGLFSLFKK